MWCVFISRSSSEHGSWPLLPVHFSESSLSMWRIRVKCDRIIDGLKDDDASSPSWNTMVTMSFPMCLFLSTCQRRHTKKPQLSAERIYLFFSQRSKKKKNILSHYKVLTMNKLARTLSYLHICICIHLETLNLSAGAVQDFFLQR